MAKSTRQKSQPSILLAWVGATDLNAAEIRQDPWIQDPRMGPIGRVVSERDFDRLSLLYSYGRDEAQGYRDWLQKHTDADIDIHELRDFRPTDHSAIYDRVDAHIEALVNRFPGARLTYHLSPGTPAMASVWLLLARTSRPARLIASTIEHGVEDVELPFRLAFEAISEAYRGADDILVAALDAEPHVQVAFKDIVYVSEAMDEVLRMAKRVALTDITTLILGESGTGKELLASAIHNASDRRGAPLIAVNCGAIPESLLESELFGHEKNAFTGASRMRKGLFEKASEGTIFLDEVGELPPKAQVQLLRAIQSKTIRRVGGHSEIPINVRIIAATHRDLKIRVSEDSFREDLYFRLAVAVLRVPALRERPADIPPLIDHILDELKPKLATQPGPRLSGVSPEARRLLLGHIWRGNVRELENVLTRAALWTRSGRIEVKQVEETLAESPRRHGDIFNIPLNEDFDIRALHDRLSGHYIRRALRQSGGNKTRTAELLGLKSRTVLNDWMNRCGVSDPNGIE